MKLAVATVISNNKITSDFYLMWLNSPELASEARPGQFVMVRCGEDTLLRRPLSIHQRNGSKIAFLFKVAGKGTHWLSQRQASDVIDLLGPLGNGFTLQLETRNILLVAGGIGIAPLSFLSQEAVEKTCEIKLLVGAKTSAQLDIEHLFPQGVDIIFTSEDGFKGKKGLVTMLIPDYFSRADQVFACGPMTMYRDMANKYHSFLKDKSVQVSLEVRMGCGLGVCYGCTVKTKNGLKQVCKDGPIFNLEDILWDELAYNY